MGKGAVYAGSIKQKLNTKSSTETEIVAVNDMMSQVLWSRYFLEAQGYTMGASMIFQDNMSAMLLERNGKGSSGKRTRHMNVWYFFIKDRISANEVKVSHQGTENMIGDFFTKPLQGQKFIDFRRFILNLK